jgi:K+/H+ antiporter YhaU regulatory subunit KhtT
MAGKQESGRLDLFQGRNRSAIAIIVTADGRRINVPLRDLNTSGVSLLDLIRSLLAGLESLLGLLITGSRRGNGGTRRDGSR